MSDPSDADAPPAVELPPVPVPPAAVDDDRSERRRLVLAASLFFGALVVLIALVAVLGDDDGSTASTTTVACDQGDAACLAAQRDQGRPGIIPGPNEGRAPSEPGEPGGWEQVTLFFVIVGALAVIATLVVRSVRRSAAAGHRTPSA